ncbi:Uncharacterised protein [Mycobacteroides abscessus subsp. abscessus]|nr:Uncharacterised protein [Mycobacteroides abscessus subsp. abscessus]SHY97762.1 Uncharacterised protein [Mycobacteroides abscessus subsp. abscessus]SHZ22447.1 Uncharacterised protein [Mycobacteroides abscessus subsp. abscessus]SIE47630.1 Uncharacterised protein [Mycobacteroides abscessus subsp. abscessus]SIF25643.1 Uncharacterised protein [Mycobacteroides abscessus subsp. abscessus]
MNKVSNHLSLFTIREYLIFEVASLKMLSIVSDSLSPNTQLVACDSAFEGLICIS